MGLVAGAVAIGGLAVLHADTPQLYHELLRGGALAALLVSVLAGIATLTLVGRSAFEPARYSAAVAVAAIIAGWALARYPVLLPGLTVDRAAASHDVLVTLIVAVIAGATLLFPSLGLLFRLSLTGRFAAAEHEAQPTPEPPPEPVRAIGPRPAVALLILGVGLLNVASAPWAHGIGGPMPVRVHDRRRRGDRAARARGGVKGSRGRVTAVRLSGRNRGAAHLPGVDRRDNAGRADGRRSSDGPMRSRRPALSLC